MPRVIRDSDEETTAESKSSTRRTRATASSSTTDSPARRTTRSNKQLSIIESSPESLDDDSPQPTVRKTRSRAATLDKSSAGVAKNLRSRKNSASSNLSETIDLDVDQQQQQITQKRVTRKAAAVAAAIGTPTKTSLRSRNLRAGSEAKSTPPATSSRSTRVTRASSVDPINTPNESVVGTPVKRRTRASIVPVQQTVAEEQEDKNEISEIVNKTVVEIDEDSENEPVSTKGKSNEKVAKKSSSSSSNKEKAEKDTSTEQSNFETSGLTIEGNMTDKSCTSNGEVKVEETSEKSTLEALETHSITFKQESFISREQGGENSQSIESVVLSADQNLIKSDGPDKNERVQNNSSVDMIEEYEHVDVENFTLTDESIDVVDSPKKTDVRDTLALDIKDSYVKLDRTTLVENIFGGKQQQLEENKNNDLCVKIADVDRGGETSQNDVIANAKTAIVLVNDFVKSNEYFNSLKDEKIFDSGISLNNRGGEDVNSNASIHKSDDDQSIVTIEDDDDEVLSLKLSSPNSHAMKVGEADGDKLIIEALPDDEMSNEDKSIATGVNSSSIHNIEKADFYLKDNDNGVELALPESKSNAKDVVNEKNIEMACVDDEIGDESRLISENIGTTDASKMMNASVGIHSLHENLQQNGSIEDRPITPSDVKTPSIIVDLEEEETAAEAIVGSGGDVEINESAVASNGVEAEKLGVADSSEQLESMDTSSSSAMPESNLKENLEISNSRNATTNSNEIESKLRDKTGVPCAVTDADGENASRPPKDDGDDEAARHETSSDTTPAKSPAKKGGGKRKSQTQVTDSDLDESAENLFQDIPAEEWSAAEQMKSAEATNDLSTDSFDGSVAAAAAQSLDEQEIDNRAKNKRKSLSGKERGGGGGGGKSVVGTCETESQQADLSPTKGRKSLERKRDSGGGSSDSGIQNGTKLTVESDSSDDDNELLNESRDRRSFNGSLKAQSKNDSVAEKLSKSLLADVPKSSNKSRKSLNNSMQFNVSVFNTFRKKNDSASEFPAASCAERNDSVEGRRDENSEAMQVDEGSGDEISPGETSKANESQSRRKSHNKSLVGQSHDDDNAAEKLTVSLKASSQAAKRSSLDKSLNRSRRKSLVAHDEQVDDSNKSAERITDDESQSKTGVSSGDVSLNESKRSRKSLSEKINVSACKLPAESEEMEVDVVTAASGDEKSAGKSRKSKSCANSSKLSLDQEAPPKSGRKSANKSLNVSAADDVVTKSCEEVEKVEVTKKSPIEPSLNESAAEKAEDEEGEEEKEEEQETIPSAIDRSLQKSIERMKFSNPPKHDVSTVVQVNTSSAEDDSDDSQVPNFIFKLSDEEEETEDSSEENAENDVDSDVEREYNLGGRDITKYSDDEVPGDDCRVSEEESSDNEDDGADLEDFVVPDDDGDDDDDEDEEEEEEKEEEEDDDVEGEDENEEEDKDEDNSDEDGDEDLEEDSEGVGIEGPSAKKVSELKKNVSINSSQSTVQNSKVQLRRSGFSQSSGSESDDETTEIENKTSNENFDYVADSEKFFKDSKKLEQQSIMLSNMIKAQNSSLKRRSVADKSSKSTKSNVSSNSSTTNKEKSLNVSEKNKSLSTSKRGREDKNSSKSNGDKSTAAHNGSGKNKSVLLVENGHAESSSSDSDEDEEATSEASEGESMASPSSESGQESSEEEGEDYYRVVELTNDASLAKPKSKKLMDCSTPKPGAKKPADMSKDNLSISAAAASRRKSGSLNDLSSTKLMSSRLSVGEATASKSMKLGDTSMKLKDDVEIIATPETLARPRQAWKLIPLNQTAHPAVEDTPGTKFLKKAKLNESFPVDLESMKSGNPSPSAKTSKKAAPKQEPPREKHSSKKRKLLDLSHAHDEDSVLKVAKKNKKRARLNESLVSAGDAEAEREAGDAEQSSNEQQHEPADVAGGGEEAEKAQRSQKRKKNKERRGREAEAGAPGETEAGPSKKRRDKRAQPTAGEEGAQRAERPKKSKPTVSTAEPSVSEQKPRKKRQKQAGPDDEAPESLGLEAARRVALKQTQQQAEGARAAKETLKKKRRDAATSKSLKRLPEDVVESLTDEPLCQRPDKRQKLSRDRERSVMMPSKSMFSPGKSTPENLRVDDGYVSLSSAGGTTQFAVVNLHKARKVAKKSAAVLNFRNKMLARNKRMPTSMYLDYLKRQKAKGNL